MRVGRLTSNVVLFSTVAFETLDIFTACRAMDQSSHYVVPVPSEYAGRYPTKFGSGRISNIWIRYIPNLKW